MTGPQGMGPLIPNIDVLTGGEGETAVHEPVIYTLFPAITSSGTTPGAIAISDHHHMCWGAGFTGGSGVEVPGVGETLGSIDYLSTGSHFIWCRYLKTYDYNDVSPEFPWTGLDNRGGGHLAVLTCADPDEPIVGTIAGTTGVDSCQTTSFVTTGPNQRILIMVGCTGTTVPAAPAGYVAIGDHWAPDSGTAGRVQIYASTPGSFPNEGATVPAVTLTGAGNTWMTCKSLIVDGYSAPAETPLIVSARVHLGGANTKFMPKMPGAKRGDVWCCFGASDSLNTNSAIYYFGLYDSTINDAYRFGIVNDAEAGQDCTFAGTLDGGNVSAGAVLYLLLRNVRRSFPIDDWGSDTIGTVGGAYPDFTLPNGPTADQDGLAVDLLRWTNNGMHILSDSEEDDAGSRSSSAANCVAHGELIDLGSQKSGRTITMTGTSQAIGQYRTVTIVGEANDPPTRKTPRPTQRGFQRFTTAATSQTIPAFACNVGDVLYVGICSRGVVTSIPGDWTMVSQIATAGESKLCVIRKVASGTLEPSFVVNFAGSSLAWASYWSVDEAAAAESFVKTDLSGGSVTPHTHSFDFSDVTEPTVALLFTARGEGSGTVNTGPHVGKDAVNKIWHGPDWTTFPMGFLRHVTAAAIVDGSVSDVSQIVRWKSTSLTTGNVAIAICVGLTGELY